MDVKFKQVMSNLTRMLNLTNLPNHVHIEYITIYIVCVYIYVCGLIVYLTMDIIYTYIQESGCTHITRYFLPGLRRTTIW